MRNEADGRPAVAEGVRTGSILILALWTLFFLSMLAVAVGTRVSTQLDLARQLRMRTTAYYLARAGVERAVLWTACNSNAWDGLGTDEKNFKDIPFGAGTFSVTYVSVGSSGEAVTNHGVIGAESRVNINKADLQLLAAVIRVVGGEDPTAAGEIAASIVDWRDKDDEVLTGGAEGSYYRGLPQPYSCANDDFRSVEELALVKGMRSELFRKIRPHVTLYGTGKVNINSAGPMVLRSLADAGGAGSSSSRESLVDKMARFREAGNSFKEANASAISGELGRYASLSPEEKAALSGMMRYATIRSTCFGGTAEGRVNAAGGPGGETRRIAFVFDRESQSRMYWHEF